MLLYKTMTLHCSSSWPIEFKSVFTKQSSLNYQEISENITKQACDITSSFITYSSKSWKDKLETPTIPRSQNSPSYLNQSVLYWSNSVPFANLLLLELLSTLPESWTLSKLWWIPDETHLGWPAFQNLCYKKLWWFLRVGKMVPSPQAESYHLLHWHSCMGYFVAFWVCYQ